MGTRPAGITEVDDELAVGELGDEDESGGLHSLGIVELRNN